MLSKLVKIFVIVMVCVAISQSFFDLVLCSAEREGVEKNTGDVNTFKVSYAFLICKDLKANKVIFGLHMLKPLLFLVDIFTCICWCDMLLYFLLLRTCSCCHHCGGHHGRRSGARPVHVSIARRHHALSHVAFGPYEYYVQLKEAEQVTKIAILIS